jgi:repressor LexA
MTGSPRSPRSPRSPGSPGSPRSEETRQRVYAFVRRRILAGDAPTTREVQHHLGFRAVQSARQHLEALVAAGKLIKLPGRSRGYRLPGFDVTGGGVGGGTARATGPVGQFGQTGFFPTGPLRLVPRLGRVQAGALSEAIETPDGYLPVADVGADVELFALTVRGESMTGAGILPGDTVVVRRQETARDGAIVVALVGDEATVKRLRLRKGRVELHPENAAFAPIIPGAAAEVRILGKVVEVRRRLS